MLKSWLKGNERPGRSRGLLKPIDSLFEDLVHFSFVVKLIALDKIDSWQDLQTFRFSQPINGQFGLIFGPVTCRTCPKSDQKTLRTFNSVSRRSNSLNSDDFTKKSRQTLNLQTTSIFQWTLKFILNINKSRVKHILMNHNTHKK